MSACATCGHDMTDHRFDGDDIDLCMVPGCWCPSVPTAEGLRDDAIRTVAASEAPFVTVAFEVLRDDLCSFAVHSYPIAPVFITSEDVWARMEARGYGKPAEPRAMGAVMRRGVREGLIVPTDRFVRGRSPSRHAAPIRVFEVVR